MSKLKDFIFQDEEIKQKEVTFSLRKRRAKPLHPDDVANRLAKKAAKRSEKLHPTSWKPEFGYLLILKDWNQVRHKRSAKTYKEAIFLRSQEFSTGKYMECWIVEKKSKIDNS